MHWADRIAKEIIASGKYQPYWVDDMKTPSGFSHVGSLLGPVIHSMIFRALKHAGKEVNFTFVMNDFDHADSLSEELKPKYEQYMGMSLKMIPSPDPKFESMADLFSNDFINSIRSLGVEAEILSSWEMYHQGKFDEVIRIALDNAEKIQDIYQKVSGSKKKEEGWLPFQVICEKCGKLGTTKVFAWDGEKVSYKCEPDLVKWAVGCGHEGKISPFGGTGKLPWKVDWPAHWKVIGVTIEGAGKDHASAGGSYDIAMAICKEVFKYDQPYKLPYEFILIGGRKMSSSKGLGLKAHDLVKILPPPVGRFLFARADIKSQSNFDPVGTEAIPDLFDEYDAAWKAYDKGGDLPAQAGEKLARTYVLSQIDKIPEKEKGFFVPRFRDVANYLSQGLTEEELLEKFTEIKNGKIDDSEYDVLRERIKYAKVWLTDYAPDEFRFDMTNGVPEKASSLSDLQKKYLEGIIKIYNEGDDAGSLQVSLYELAKELEISTKDAFGAIYLSFIGRTHGPRAGFLLTNYGREKAFERIQNVVREKPKSKVKVQKNDQQYGDFFRIDPNVKEKYPSISVGIALIKNVNILGKNSELEKEKERLLSSLDGLTTKKLGEYPEVKSYRKLYKEMGVDWHSRRPSPEALLRRVALNKGLYTINTCVDSYNLVVMSDRVSVGAFVADKVKFPTSLRFAKEGEEILLLGDSEPTKYTNRELAYFDQDGGYNMDFNYRDAQRTMVTENTKSVWINVDGIYDVTPEKVEKALNNSIENIIKYCGGSIEFKGVII